VKKSHRGGNKGGEEKFALATFFNRFQPFFDYMWINLSSSASVNKNFMDWNLGEG